MYRLSHWYRENWYMYHLLYPTRGVADTQDAWMTKYVLNALFGRRVARETGRYLRDLAETQTHATAANAERLLSGLGSTSGAKILLGHTSKGDRVAVPAADIVKAHGTVTGGSGSGKTRFGLLIIKSLVESPPDSAAGFGVVDPKGELFCGALGLLAARLAVLDAADPEAGRELRRRIVIIDFSSRNLLSSYNLLARPKGCDPDFFAGSRADLLLDLLSGDDAVSLSGTGLLRRMILLLSEFNLPVTWAADLLSNPNLRSRLLHQTKQKDVSTFFKERYADLPKQTIGALIRRLEALTASESVRLTLSGPAAPDFRELQDRAAIVLINCFGNSISRGVRRLLQALVLSDVTQAVFARKNTERPFLWLCDEAQTFFATPQLRENLTDLLTMSRSFGSFFTFFTQNLATAVHDQKMRSILDTNVRWTFSMRGQPADCDFLKSALPVSGKKYQPADDPFQESRRYSLNEERALVHEGIAHLPDREGYLWLRTRSGEALRIRTADCPVPEGEALDAATGVLQADPAVGGRLTRSEYERVIDLREQEWREKTSPAEPEMDLAAQFERRRGRVR